ncbi:NAD(+)/NADH kinase [Enterobacter cloacae complex sp. P29RS]|uniref:NAD(+)/NADH kinase n=1 Tax=Enterobacter cloacae complex sp. P29RS TaxID=2779563 RepID=UPI0018689B2E|nr:NAD(+)/NADH kinase [Enterobacter cloacae complex sp. P29RS]MBE3175385.1 NAD(+)/NADH kinase [Enterobacter cloacae complex sp. P29RS]
MRQPAAPQPWIGIIANPVSARDIRRVVGNAGTLPLAERVNLLLRLMAALAACGIAEVRMMPDREGLRALLLREVSQNSDRRLPQLSWLPMEVSATVQDSFHAAQQMQQAGAAAIVVLGGDGTHRAVARHCGRVPIVGLSTGTNNAWPELHEPTVLGLALGLYARGSVPAERALVWNKWLDITLTDADGSRRQDIALVDAAVTDERFIGARSLWSGGALSQLFLSFAEPQAVGMSAIGGLLQPIGRLDAGGLLLTFGPGGCRLQAPLVPGVIGDVAIARWQSIDHGQSHQPLLRQGVIAVDGERELTFGPQQRVTIALREHAFRSLDVTACLRYAAAAQLLRHGA